MDDHKAIGIPAFIGIYVISVILFVPGLILCIGNRNAANQRHGYSQCEGYG
jgi:hypothetical protein